jgi:hypothetical protein
MLSEDIANNLRCEDHMDHVNSTYLVLNQELDTLNRSCGSLGDGG